MRNICFLLCALIIAVNCCGCDFSETTDFYYNATEISSVHIVSLGDPIPNALGLEETFINEIENVSAFLEKLNAIERKVPLGEPICIEPGDIAMKIIYLNGDYDLITYDAQVKFRKEMNLTGYCIFSKSEFNALLNEYIDTESTLIPQ